MQWTGKKVQPKYEYKFQDLHDLVFFMNKTHPWAMIGFQVLI